MIMTDQDHDGSHIKGLFVNLFDHYWPDLIRVPGFLSHFRTPIVKVSKRGQPTRSFYSIPDYRFWLQHHHDATRWHPKYYKVRMCPDPMKPTLLTFVLGVGYVNCGRGKGVLCGVAPEPCGFRMARRGGFRGAENGV